MVLVDYVLEKQIFIKKINAINLEKDNNLSTLDDHTGRAKVLVGIKLEEDEKKDFFVIESDYDFEYNEIAFKIELSFLSMVYLDRKLDHKPNDEEVEPILNMIMPLFDKKIEKINSILNTKIPTISKIESKSESD